MGILCAVIFFFFFFFIFSSCRLLLPCHTRSQDDKSKDEGLDLCMGAHDLNFFFFFLFTLRSNGLMFFKNGQMCSNGRWGEWRYLWSQTKNVNRQERASNKQGDEWAWFKDRIVGHFFCIEVEWVNVLCSMSKVPFRPFSTIIRTLRLTIKPGKYQGSKSNEDAEQATKKTSRFQKKKKKKKKGRVLEATCNKISLLKLLLKCSCLLENPLAKISQLKLCLNKKKHTRAP